MNIKNSYKGPFWVKCNYVFDRDNNVTVVFQSAQLIYCRISIDEKTPSHKEVWSHIETEVADKSWNYYPRGRVEYTRNKAVIYANPIVFQIKILRKNSEKLLILQSLSIWCTKMTIHLIMHVAKIILKNFKK